MIKLFAFFRSQGLLTKVAALTCVLTVFLGFYATVGRHPLLMITAGGVSGVSAGFAIGALRQSTRLSSRRDRRAEPDRRHENHAHAQPVG